MGRYTVAGTGASGALYFERVVRALLIAGHDVDVVVSAYGKLTLEQETSFGAFDGDVKAWLESAYGEHPGSITMHAVGDQTSRIASGSARCDGMIVVPCSMKTLAGIANGLASNLIERAADVTLKERRPLVIVPRETPFSIIHLENMLKLARAGATVVPANPAFYQQPESFADLADFVAQRALSVAGVDVTLFPAWQGKASLKKNEQE
ncbi:MAG: flavin prenyltransferase UbiX [Deltaproteobacteria bacterium]|jgi:4-hydroxy-3-polyprenylbenzoate decarboxylase